MFKKILIATALIAMIGALVFGAVNNTFAQNGNPGSAQGSYGRNSNAVINLPAASGTLNAEEAAALLYMREEEKLAHDVYVTLGSQWNLPIFQNISRSEQTHTDAIKALIDRYGLTDPASSKVGVFTNPDLQALYNDLVTKGGLSLADALKAGATIEEIDIRDLETHLAQISKADIQQVFTNLERGSNNHLRAFVSALNKQTGGIYQPQYLSAETYQAIISAGMQSGGNGNGGGNRQGGYRGGRP